MKKPAKLIGYIVGVLGVTFLVVMGMLAHKVKLVALTEIKVDSYPIPNSQESVGNLSPGQELVVIGCDDLKSYMAVHVRFDNGKNGYVIDGKYELKMFPPWSSIDSPISFSCSKDWPP